jgi:hypothetical protein
MNESRNSLLSNRKVKSDAFTTYFSDPGNAAQLYTALEGVEARPEKILKLSDSYLVNTLEPMLELSTKVININLPVNHSILERCRPLYEYSWFIERIKEYIRRGMNRDMTIKNTVKDCEKNGVMAEFMREYGSEVSNMLFTQFNMEDALRANYEEGFEDREAEGEKIGEKKGKTLLLIQQVSVKLQKEKAADVIAEEPEADPGQISQICAAIQKCGLNDDPEKIFAEYEKMSKES